MSRRNRNVSEGYHDSIIARYKGEVKVLEIKIESKDEEIERLKLQISELKEISSIQLNLLEMYKQKNNDT